MSFYMGTRGRIGPTFFAYVEKQKFECRTKEKSVIIKLERFGTAKHRGPTTDMLIFKRSSI